MPASPYIEADELGVSEVMSPWEHVVCSGTLYGRWCPSRLDAPYQQRYKVRTRKTVRFLLWSENDLFLASGAPSREIIQGKSREVFVRVIKLPPFPESPWGELRSHLADPSSRPVSLDYLALMSLNFLPSELECVYSYVQNALEPPLWAQNSIVPDSKPLLQEGRVHRLRKDARLVKGTPYRDFEVAQRFRLIRETLYVNLIRDQQQEPSEVTQLSAVGIPSLLV